MLKQPPVIIDQFFHYYFCFKHTDSFTVNLLYLNLLDLVTLHSMPHNVYNRSEPLLNTILFDKLDIQMLQGIISETLCVSVMSFFKPFSIYGNGHFGLINLEHVWNLLLELF